MLDNGIFYIFYVPNKTENTSKAEQVNSLF